ncbi:Gfo/Idh/MocA family protein [Thermaurantiacus sp.]
MTRLLVIGFGSIGARHARVATSLGIDTVVASRRGSAAGLRTLSRLEDAVAGRITHAIIATETARHAADLAALRAAGFSGPVLVEKPVFTSTAAAQSLPEFNKIGEVYVGYNLRFHPLTFLLQTWLSSNLADLARFHCGQHIGSWRPGRPLAESYSVQRAGGGGILRDLSHEIDMARFLLGEIGVVHAFGGRTGRLPGDADDHWALVLQARTCPQVVITLDGLQHLPERRYRLTSARETVEADFIAGGWLSAAGRSPVSLDPDETYRAQLLDFLGPRERLARLSDGLAVLEVVEAAEAGKFASCPGA